MENVKEDYYYNKGFHDGYLKGQEISLKLLTDYMSREVRPIHVKFDNEEQAARFIEYYKQNKA